MCRRAARELDRWLHRLDGTWMTRLVMLMVSLVSIAGLAFLTYAAIASEGINVGTVVSVFVVGLLAVGIIGALLTPPRQ
jgi:hypothetical protein